MIVYEDECVGCPTEMGCLGMGCPYQEVPHLHCDRCDAECETLYAFDGEELCEDCLLDNFDKITLD